MRGNKNMKKIGIITLYYNNDNYGGMKGNELFESANRNMKMKEVSYEDGVKGNPAEYRSCARPSERDKFFEDMRTMSFEELKEKYAAPVRYSLKTRVKRKIKAAIKKILRVIGGGRK